MHYKIFVLLLLFLNSCVPTDISTKDVFKTKDAKHIFINKGFGLMYDDIHYKNKDVSKKIDKRSLIIFQKNLKKDTKVKITNLLNNKSILARVGDNANYPLFYNAVLSKRIFDELELNLNEPYIEILEVTEGTTFVAKKLKCLMKKKKLLTKLL